MIDAAARKKIRVSTDGTAGPYIMVPVDQLSEVRSVLDANRVRYSVDENAISLNGQTAVSVVNLGKGGDATAIQKLLDAKQ